MFFSAQGKRSRFPTTVTIRPVEIGPYTANMDAGFSGNGQKRGLGRATFCKRPKMALCGKSAKRQIPQGLALSCIRPGRLAAVSSTRAHSSKQSARRRDPKGTTPGHAARARSGLPRSASPTPARAAPGSVSKATPSHPGSGGKGARFQTPFDPQNQTLVF